MRMPCTRAMLSNTTIYPKPGPFGHEANCCLSANATYNTSEATLSTRFPHSLIHCRIMSKNHRLPGSLSGLSRTPKVMPTLDWKPEPNDVIIPCVTISNPLVGSLTLISQINGPIRCRKKHSRSFMLRQPFSLIVYGSSSSIPSQERRQQPLVTTLSHVRLRSSQLLSILQVHQVIFRRTEDWFSWTPLDLAILTSMTLLSCTASLPGLKLCTILRKTITDIKGQRSSLVLFTFMI